MGTDDPMVGIFLKLLLEACCGGGGLLVFGSPLTNGENSNIYIHVTYLKLGRY